MKFALFVALAYAQSSEEYSCEYSDSADCESGSEVSCISGSASCDEDYEDSACATDYTDYCVCEYNGCEAASEEDDIDTSIATTCVAEADCSANTNGFTKCGTSTVNGDPVGPSVCVTPA